MIDYTCQDFARNGGDYDLLLDNVGNRTATGLLRPVRSGGTVVVVGFTSLRLMAQQSLLGPRAARRRGIIWAGPASEDPGPEHAETLRALLEAGDVVPRIEASYVLERLPEAMGQIMTGHARAKIVVRISPPPAPS